MADDTDAASLIENKGNGDPKQALSSNLPAMATISTTIYNAIMWAGGVFLFASLLLFFVTGMIAYQMSNNKDLIPTIDMSHGEVNFTVIAFNTVNFLLKQYLPPMLTFAGGFICGLIGIKLLKTSGAVSTPVISPQDYPLLAPAIANGNEQAINLYIRLSSLSGATGTVTKIGLTGLPLATIILTLLLAFGGLFNPQFFDLAKLTLGAFLGSFVQRQSSAEANIVSNRPLSQDLAKSNLK